MNRKIVTAACWAVVLSVGFMIGSAISYAVTEAGWITAWVGKGSRRNTTEFKISSGSTAGAAANFLPGTDNTNALGTSSLRFSDVQTMDATIGDDLTVTDRLIANGPFQLLVSTAPRTALALSSLTFAAGSLIYNSTDGEVCVATGTAQTSFVVISSQTAQACRH